MNQKTNDFSFQKILMIWAGLTILLVFAGLFVFGYSINAKAFITLANALNLFFFLCFFLFRKNIENIVAEFIDESKDLSVNTKCNYEKRISFLLTFFFVVLCSIIVFFALFDIEHYSLFIKEDGVAEYGSALFWFCSAIIVCFHTLKSSRVETNRYQLLSNTILMTFFIVCFGEEISWGQRLFGIETPEWIGSVNVQNEITLHNIGSTSVFSNVFFLLTIVFFLFVPFLIKKHTQIKQVLYLIHFPIPNRFAVYIYIGSLSVWIFVGLRFGTLGFHPFSFFPEQYYVQMDDEVFELLIAYSFLCFSILNSTTQLTIIKKHQSKA